jgi:hypothetical protein
MRHDKIQNLFSFGLGVTVFALLAWNLRVGLFAIFAFLYLCSYPVIQFDVRHFFHLSGLTWLPVGLMISLAIREVQAQRLGKPSFRDRLHKRALLQSGAVLAALVAVGFALYGGLLLRQNAAVRTLLASYATAGADAFDLVPAPLAPDAKGGTEPVASAPRVKWLVPNPQSPLPGLCDQMLRLDFGLNGDKQGATEITTTLRSTEVATGFDQRFSFTLDSKHPKATLFLPVYYIPPRTTELVLSMPATTAHRLERASWVRPKELPSLWLTFSTYADNGTLSLMK